MLRIYTIILIVAASFDVSAQTKNFYPREILAVDLSREKQKELDRQAELLAKEPKTQKEQVELEKLLEKHGETIESIWDVLGAGCSWYCGGGNYKVKVSSYLKDSIGIDYSAHSANDFLYNTAWVAGRNKSGIGEYIEYYFKNESPRITRIVISNGYMKSETTWKNNNRIKKLKLYINGRFHGFFNLQDSRTDQAFEIGTLGHNKDGSDLVLRFEIAEIYKGSRFDHTAITEIYFDGIDVH